MKTHPTPQPRTDAHPTRTTTLADLIRQHIPQLRPHSAASYRTLDYHLRAFAGDDIPLRVVDAPFLHRFAQFLLQRTAVASARTHIYNLKALLHDAQRRGLLVQPLPTIADLLPSRPESERPYLTYEEICRLLAAPCPRDETRQAFLFAIHTGLRLSDIETLRWGDLRQQHDRSLLVKMQVKTRREVRVPLDSAARQLLQRRRPAACAAGDPIFTLPSRTTVAKDLRAWAQAAQVDKPITFHVSRHTFATLMITQGVGIYEVSQLCGHADVKTTERYVRLLDQRRFEAISALDALFG